MSNMESCSSLDASKADCLPGPEGVEKKKNSPIILILLLFFSLQQAGDLHVTALREEKSQNSLSRTLHD